MASNGTAGYRVGDLWIDIGRGEVRRGDTAIPLPRLTFDLLLALVEAAPNLVSLDELMRRVWPGLVVSPETVSQRVKLLRRALGDDVHSPRYILGVRGRGYRLVAPVEAAAAVGPIQSPREVPGPVTERADSDESGHRIGAEVGPPRHGWPFPRSALLAATALLAGVALAVTVATLSRTATEEDSPSTEATPTMPRPVVAVLPFANPGVTADDRSLADAMQSDIIVELSRNHSIDVVAATSVEKYRDRASPATDVRREIGATHLLEGSVQRAGGRIRVEARLVDARTAGQVWAEDFDREFAATKLFAVRGEIVLAVADALQVGLSDDERNRAEAPSTQSIEAWARENAARVQLERRTTESILEAERLFRQTIALDPTYARAYSGLADAIWLKADYSGLPWLASVTEAERLVNQALRLDPNLVEALTTRAKIAQERLDYVTAEADYQRVFELNPSYAPAYNWYSQLLYQQGREVEARDATRRAVDLDPMSVLRRVNMGLSVAKLDDVSESVAWMEKAREIDPTNQTWARGKAIAFAFASRFDEALHWELEAIDLDSRSAHALVGVARWHLELDDLDGARTWLEAAMEDGREVYGSLSHAGLLALYAGQTAEAVDFARRALAQDPFEMTAFMVLDADALRRGDNAAVIAAVQSSYPELAGSGVPGIRRASLLPATDLALALQRTGDTERARALLDAASVFLAVARRNGTHEYFIDEARVAEIRGDHETALRVLGKLVADGWRGPYWRYYRDHDPAFDRLREDPRFRNAFAVVEQDLRSQRSRAVRAGDFDRSIPGRG